MISAIAKEFLEFYQAHMFLQTGRSTHLTREEADFFLQQYCELNNPSESEIDELGRGLNLLLESNGDRMRWSTDKLISMLTPDLQEPLKKIPVGFSPSMAYNAMTIMSPSNEPIVVINSGLDLVLSQVSIACVLDYPNHIAPELKWDEIAKYIFDWTCFSMTRKAEDMPSMLATKHSIRRNAAGGIYANAINFVIAHELGHAILNHLGKIDESREDEYFKALELEADSYAIDMVIASTIKYTGEISHAIVGIETALRMLWLRDEIFDTAQPPRRHPTAEARLKNFYKILTDKYTTKDFDPVYFAFSFNAHFLVCQKIGKATMEQIKK